MPNGDNTLVRELKTANMRFYEAYESKSLDAMAKIWLHIPQVRCVHPGCRMIFGWDAVRVSWEEIFENLVSVKLIISDIYADGEGDLGIVSGIENVAQETRDGSDEYSVQTTNVFRRVNGAWRLAIHHAAPIMDDEEEEEDEEGNGEDREGHGEEEEDEGETEETEKSG